MTERLSNVSGLEVGGVCAGVLVCWCLLSKGLLQPLSPSLPQWLDIYSDFSEANGFAIYFLVLVDTTVNHVRFCAWSCQFRSDTVQSRPALVEGFPEMLLDRVGNNGDWHFL